ncbi:MAG TPA: hypothetical protein VNI01_05225, partial [Elusimicrobiota bacterium]|nr:hypothetical protein [Elusimicrobiota bacterium]
MSKRPRAGAASLLPVRAPLAARKEFYSLLSHVHRTPLVGACGYIDFVLNEYAGKVQKKQRESLGQAREAILQLQRVIDAFMDLIAFELDLVPAASAAIDLAAFLRGLREELSSWARAERRSLRLSVPDSPVFVRADPEWLRVLVRELFSNAVRASPSRSAIEIELRKAYNSAVFTVGDQ